MRNFLITVVFLMAWLFDCKADSLVVTLHPVLMGEDLHFDKGYRFEDYTLFVDQLWLYSGHVTNNAQLMDTSYYLLGQNEERARWSFVLPIHCEVGDQIQLTWGIDSLSQVSGAMRGDMDPQWGMYWAWQSGYICAKFEGRVCFDDGTKKNIVFHFGGYRKPTCVAVGVFQLANDKALDIQWSIDDFLAGCDFRSLDHLMSPGKIATQMFFDFIPN